MTLLRRALRGVLASAAGRRGAMLLLGTALLGYVLNAVDPWLGAFATRLHGVEDFSVWIYAVEGGATRVLQAFAPIPWVVLLLYVYVSFFPALYAAVALALHDAGHDRLVRAAVLVLPLQLLLAAPFFAFVSVYEPWHSHVVPADAKARLLTDDLDPGLEPQFRAARGIENNLPSLHASTAFAGALLARRSRERRLARVAAAGAAAVVFSTLALGFHWITDAIAGAVHAWVCVALALRWGDRVLGAR